MDNHFARRLWLSFGIIVASIVIAAGALYFFAGNLSANADAIVSARAALNKQNSVVANLAGLKQQAAQAAQYQTAMGQLVPNQYGLVTFEQWFSEQGAKYHVSASASFQGAATPSAGSTPGSAAFSFTVSGSLDDVDSFLNFVSAQSPDFLIAFNSFNVTGDGINYNATGLGTVYSQ